MEQQFFSDINTRSRKAIIFRSLNLKVGARFSDVTKKSENSFSVLSRLKSFKDAKSITKGH